MNQLNRSMIRLQEFYESPFDDIRGKYFTVEKYKASFKKHNNTKVFKYWDVWTGDNIPGHIIRTFYEVYSEHKLNDFELQLKSYLTTHHLLNSKKKFYIVACVKGSAATMPHEIAHAFYYLDKKYKATMDRYTTQLDPKLYAHIQRILLKEYGYMIAVVADEMQAYLATETIGIMLPRWKLKPQDMDWDLVTKMQVYAHDYIDDHIKEHNFW